jgi:hypothetical protein
MGQSSPQPALPSSPHRTHRLVFATEKEEAEQLALLRSRITAFTHSFQNVIQLCYLAREPAPSFCSMHSTWLLGSELLARPLSSLQVVDSELGLYLYHEILNGFWGVLRWYGFRRFLVSEDLVFLD